MSADPPDDPLVGATYGDRHETEAQRIDRNVAELLQELRVAAIGVQVLFGFLFALPFSNAFSSLDPEQRRLYVADLLLAALATALLTAPVAYHRIVFRRHQKHDLLRFANALQSHKLLDAKHTEELTTGKVDAGRGKYAYGFQESMINGARCFGHGGGAPGMNGMLQICPASGYVIAVLANLDPPAASRVSDFITNRLPAK